MLNLASFVREHAVHHPNRVAVRAGEQSLDYARLDALSDRVAHALVARGVARGDKVALGCPNLPAFPIVYYGILKAGAVVAPLNVLLKPREIAYHLSDADAKVYVAFEGTADLPMGEYANEAFGEVEGCEQLIVITADPAAAGPPNATTLGSILAADAGRFDLVDTAPDDTAVILYTSGTTGSAKGAELTHANMALNAIVSADLFAHKGAEPHERVVLVVLPLFHSFGQTVCMNAAFFRGGEISLLSRFDAAGVLAAMLAHRVTVFAGVPTMYWALINEAGDADDERLAQLRSTLTHAVSGGAALPADILERFEEVYGIAIMEGYGLSETSPVATFNHADRERRPGTVGQAVLGVEVRVVDEYDRPLPAGEAGEVVIRGHNVMKGYYRRPDETAHVTRGGWFHSGDIGVIDDDGYLRIVDRIKDLIVRGGFNVYPREVEEVLMTHPDVSLAAVVGVPDEEFGEEIKAFVVLAAGAEADADALRAWSETQMAAYKYPRQIEFRDSLPMNATGKILRRVLRDG